MVWAFHASKLVSTEQRGNVTTHEFLGDCLISLNMETVNPVSAHRLYREALLITCRESLSHGFRERGLYLFTHLQTLEPSLYPYNIILQ
jgi:hypothetical protein